MLVLAERTHHAGLAVALNRHVAGGAHGAAAEFRAEQVRFGDDVAEVCTEPPGVRVVHRGADDDLAQRIPVLLA